MSEIIISLEERNVKGETTRENLVQAIGLLQQSLKESLSREYAVFCEQVELLGISIDELSRMQRRPLAPVYTHPLDPTKTWHGRGRRPGWVTAFFPETAGKPEAAGKHPPAGANGATQPKETGAREPEPGREQTEMEVAAAAKGAAGKSASGGATKAPKVPAEKVTEEKATEEKVTEEKAAEEKAGEEKAAG